MSDNLICAFVAGALFGGWAMRYLLLNEIDTLNKLVSRLVDELENKP